MNLREWLDHNHMSIQDLADLAGLSRPYMSRLVAGDVHPSLAVALDVRYATRGEVPLEQLLPRALRPQLIGSQKRGNARKLPAPKASRSPATA
jgi:transcriptional regulator with XRE-family HTH domain